MVHARESAVEAQFSVIADFVNNWCIPMYPLTVKLLWALLAALCSITVSQFVSAQQPAAEQEPKSASEAVTLVRIPTYLAESITRKVVPPHDIGVPGDVVLEVIVDKDGTVLDVRGISGDSRLIQEANRAVMKWVFNPYFINGEPAKFLTEFTIQFDGKKHFAKLKVVADPLTTLNARQSVSNEKKSLTFRLTLMGEIEDTEATEAGFHTSYFRTTHMGFNAFEASDGEKVIIHNGDFVNADQARRYFDWNLGKRAAQVVKQEDKSDRHGKTVGRRAEYLAKSDSEKIWIVMWTDGEKFHLVNAPSLECALALEKQSGR